MSDGSRILLGSAGCHEVPFKQEWQSGFRYSDGYVKKKISVSLAAGGAEGAVIIDQWENTRDEWRVSRGRLYTQYSARVTQGGRR